jgi:molybdate transport system substrate-binding protein
MGQAKHLNVLSVGAVMAALHKIIPEFEDASGATVSIKFGNALATLTSLRGDVPADVAILNSSNWNYAVREGKVDPASRVDIARGKIGFGVPANAVKPRVTNAAEFIAAMRAAETIGLLDPKGGSGTSPQVLHAFEKLELLNELANKIRYYQGTGEVIAEALADGEVDIGFTMMSELIPIDGVQVVGAIPSDVLSFVSTTSAAITNRSLNLDLAKEFIQVLTSPSGRNAFRSLGLEAE